AIESTPTATGAKADHRLAVKASEVEAFARDLQVAVAANGNLGYVAGHPQFLLPLAYDLVRGRGASVVIPGEHQPPVVHALAHAINQQLGNVGKTVFYTDPVLATTASNTDSIKELVADMRAGKVDLLLI